MEALYWDNSGVLREQGSYNSVAIESNFPTIQESMRLSGGDISLINQTISYLPNGRRLFTFLRSPLDFNTGKMSLVFIQKAASSEDTPLMFSHIYDYCLSPGSNCVLPGVLYKPFSTNWSIVDNKWSICIIVIDSDNKNIKAYRNGVKVHDITNAGVMRNTSPAYITHRIGGDSAISPTVSTVSWSDFVVYQEVLSETQVQAVTQYYANRYKITLEV